MSNNMHYSKRASFWKNFIAAATITLSIFCNTEARVTKEVAEATIPYLLEAIGIMQSDDEPINTARRDAIVSMLYTDAGQRQMVNWAVNDVLPGILTAQFQPWPNNSSNIIYNPDVEQVKQERIFQLLFPKGPGTFSSYNHHSSRLGRWVLNSNGVNLQTICRNLLRPPIISNVNTESQIRSNILTSLPIDTKLDCVLFVLDICDTADQILDILDTQAAVLINYNRATVNGQLVHAYNEYNNRPVSATAATFNGRECQRTQGDCVQTLYRHLINIAVQNDETHSNNYNIGLLPNNLKNDYYGPAYVQDWNPDAPAAQNVITLSATGGEAGLTRLANHQRWHNALGAVPNVANISNGTIADIVRVLTHVCPLNEHSQPHMGQSNLGMRIIAYPELGLNPIIQTSQGAPHDNGTNQQTNATAIQNALNALDGRCNAGNERFIVKITDEIPAIPADFLADGAALPVGINAIIEIADRVWDRRIIIGIWAAGHAEIIGIIH